LIGPIVFGAMVIGDRVPQIRQYVVKVGPTMLGQNMDRDVAVVAPNFDGHLPGKVDTAQLRKS